MSSPHYDLSRAKRSLMHFGFGRVISAVSGFGWLLLAVRAMSASDYGAFVALLAVLEIFYLVTGFGLSTIVQRYVAEYRVRASGARLRQFLTRLTLLRMAVAIGCATIAAWVCEPLMGFLQIGLRQDFALALFCLLSTGVVTRYFDEVFPVLLLQGYTQALTILRNIVRALPLAWIVMAGHSIDAAQMVWIESASAMLALLAAWVMLWRYLRPESDGDAQFVASGMWRVAWRFYLVQAFGQLYGANALKLLVTRTLGLEATAVLGFAQSFVEMLRNYLPAHLLSGWIRPLLVSRYVATRDLDHLAMLSGLVLKINLMGILPLVLFFAVSGDALGSLLSGGRFTSVGTLFAWLGVLLGFQTMHLLLTMVTLTLERPNANLLATILACIGLPLAAVLAMWIGVQGVVVALIVAELIWIGIVVWMLARAGLSLRLDMHGYARILLPAIAAAAASWLFIHNLNGWGLPSLIAGGVPVGVFMLLLLFSRPLSARERAVIGKFIPLKFVPF